MPQDTGSSNFGKKVFFLYPHSVIQSELIYSLIRNEYEVCTLKDHKKIKLILNKYQDSILFINIDEHLTEQEWVEFVKYIMENQDTSTVQIGILSYNENSSLQEKYLMDLMVPCGFIQLKLGTKQSTEIILKTLEINEAKGQRKYVRAQIGPNINATFNVKYQGDYISGEIKDISSVGMSCIFTDKDFIVEKNTFLQSIQLKLHGKIIMIDGIVFGRRVVEEGPDLFVVMFTNSCTLENKRKIHEFIGTCLQFNLDEEIDQLY